MPSFRIADFLGHRREDTDGPTLGFTVEGGGEELHVKLADTQVIDLAISLLRSAEEAQSPLTGMGRAERVLAVGAHRYEVGAVDGGGLSMRIQLEGGGSITFLMNHIFAAGLAAVLASAAPPLTPLPGTSPQRPN